MKFNKRTLLGIGLGLIFILTTILLVIILSGKFKSKDENEKIIQAVIEQIVTCPDKKMIELYKDMYNNPNIALNKSDSPPPGTVVKFASTEIDKKLEEMYSPYISDEWFDSFVKHFAIQYHIFSTAVGYETKVEHIEFTQSEAIPTNYSFTIYLNYGKTNGKKNDIEIEGSAQISEKDGKVSYIQLFTGRDFLMEFWNASIGIYN